MKIFARVVELERLALRAQAMGLGQWLSFGRVRGV
jgi:hypothetical protein